MKRAAVLGWLGAFVLAFQVFGVRAFAATGLKSATVVDLKNEVLLGKAGGAEHPAVVKDEVAGSDTLRTGKKSRAELEFADKSLARLGSNTIFSFDSDSRKMNLQQGTALIHVPPGQSGARISTPAATAAILGDVVAMRVNDKGVTQIVALSKDSKGPITVTFNKTGETRTLQPGQLLTLNPADMRMPTPVDVSVDVFVQSSGLIKADGGKTKLPESAQKEIRQAETIQRKEIQSGSLEGGGLVLAKTLDRGNALDQQNQATATIVQATTGSSLAGSYSGTTMDYPTCLSPSSGTLQFTIRPDGSVFGTHVDTSSARVENFSGTINSNGNFVFQSGSGETITGTIKGGGSAVSGTYADQSCGGTFQVTRH